MSLILLSVWYALATEAALRPNYHRVAPQPKNFVSSGVFIGGTSVKEASLLDVRLLKSSKSQKERILVDLGDGGGQILMGPPAYFQAHVENSPARVVLDLSNVQMTALGKEKITESLSKSNFISSVDLTMDPEDHSTNLTLILKSPQNVSAFVNPKRPGRIYLEIHPLEEAAK